MEAFRILEHWTTWGRVAMINHRMEKRMRLFMGIERLLFQGRKKIGTELLMNR